MEKIYEVLRVLEGRPVFLNEHLERLEKSWSHYNVTAMDQRALRQGLIDLASKRQDPHNLRVEVEVATGSFTIEALEGKYPSQEMKKEGVRLGTFEHERENPQVKFIDKDIARRTQEYKEERDLYSLLYVSQGQVGECERANIFFIRDGLLITARDEDVLLGVTRAKVLELARDLGIGVIKRTVLEKELFTMEAAFMSGTSIHILPVKSIDELDFDVENPLLRRLEEELDRRIYSGQEAGSEEERPSEEKRARKAARRLYRSSTDTKLAGVCGGIGEFFNIDPSLVRLFWIIFSLMGGSGLIAYVIAAIIIPKK